MKKLHLLKRTLLLFALMVGYCSVWGADELFYTLTPAAGSNNSYAGNCDVTINGITWNVTGNASLTPWRIGGKSLTNVDRAVYSKTAMSSAITKVELTVGAASSITVNSLKLIVASDAAFNSKIDEVSGTFAANSTITFTPSPTKNWTSGAYYKFVFNVSVSGTSNKFVEFSEAKFYKAESVAYEITAVSNDEAMGTVSIDGSTITASPNSGYRVKNGNNGYTVTEGTATVAHEGYSNTLTVTPSSSCTVQVNFEAIPTLTSISLTGTYPTEFTEGDAFSHEGMTVTANYSDESTNDVTASATFSGYNMSTPGNQTITVSYTEDEVTKTTNYGITVNAIPTHTATFSVNGGTSTNDFKEGANIVFPTDPADISGKTFVGWVTDAIAGSTDVEPSFVNTATATMGSEDVTYYAVFATLIPGTATTKTDNLTTSTFESPSSYTTWSGKQATDGSDAVYAGESSGGSSYIQIRATSPSGIVTTTSGGKAKKVTITWNDATTSGRTLDIYGKNTAYTGSVNLYNDSDKGTILGSIFYGTSTELTITGDYEYIGMRSNSGAMYLDKIVVDWQTGTPDTYSAYCTTVSALPVPTITFTKDEETITELNATATEMEAVSVSCSAGDVTITVESDDDTVAEYDEGYVLAYKSGTATLTATFAGNGEYQGTTATLTVNVAKKATTTTVDVEIDDTDIYTATEGGLAAATVKAGDETVTSAAVTWTSSATNVATIDAEGNITLVGVGTTTITASYAGTDVYDASQGTYELTLTSSEPQKTNINITPNYEFYGKNAQFSGSTYDVLTGQQDNVSVTYTRNTGSTYANTTAMRFYKDNELEISAPSGYHIIGITLTVSGTYSDITTDVATYTYTTDTGVWSGDASSVTFSRPSNASSYATISNIAVTLAPTVTISDKKFASYCSPHRLDFTETDVKAYKASVNTAESKVTLTKVDVVPAGEGVILYCETAGTYAIPVTEAAASDVTGNAMKGVLERTQVLWNPTTGIYNYILQQGQFNKANDGYLKANRAYLQTNYNVGAEARALEIVFDEGETTGIDNANVNLNANDNYYNLNGQRVAQPTKGLYIVNGRKVVIR